jgi:hypothetical protein
MRGLALTLLLAACTPSQGWYRYRGSSDASERLAYQLYDCTKVIARDQAAVDALVTVMPVEARTIDDGLAIVRAAPADALARGAEVIAAQPELARQLGPCMRLLRADPAAARAAAWDLVDYIELDRPTYLASAEDAAATMARTCPGRSGCEAARKRLMIFVGAYVEEEMVHRMRLAVIALGLAAIEAGL